MEDLRIENEHCQNNNTVIINVRTDADIRIIDTRIGGTYFHNNQLMFILVPRKESITMKSPKMFIKGLAAMEKKNLGIVQIEEH